MYILYTCNQYDMYINGRQRDYHPSRRQLGENDGSDSGLDVDCNDAQLCEKAFSNNKKHPTINPACLFRTQVWAEVPRRSAPPYTPI